MTERAQGLYAQVMLRLISEVMVVFMPWPETHMAAVGARQGIGMGQSTLENGVADNMPGTLAKWITG